jgi:hypothetical protein
VKFRAEQFISKLSAPIQQSGNNSEASRKRLHNINWIIALQQRSDRKGLRFESKWKQLKIAETAAQEILWIRYPGKESEPTSRRKARPWDFRPHLETKRDLKAPKSFDAIWDIVFTNLEQLGSRLEPKRATEPILLRALATLFYRIAFMVDHTESEQTTFLAREIQDGQVRVGPPINEEVGHLMQYRPPRLVVDAISSLVPNWGQMSLEAFLHYNELLGWNEDCKYFFRETVEKKSGKWIGKTGRPNTLLTYVRIIGFILGDVEASALLGGFSRGRGVSPATDREVIKICAPFVIPAS